MRIGLTIDERWYLADVHPGATLLETLRDLGVSSVKDGCAHGDCGTCAVLIDGRAGTSCLLFAGQMDGANITTAAGLATEEGLHPLQAALLDSGGIQCGYCTPGIVVMAAELLARNPNPTEPEIRTALAGNLCRCTGYVKIIEGVAAAAERIREASHG